MDRIVFVQQLQAWTKGEISQGKWMLAISLLLVPVVISLFRGSGGLSRGMLIPVCLLLAVNLGYGGYLVSTRASRAEEIEERFEKQGEQVITQEYEKAKADNSTYIILRSIWAAMAGICALLSVFLIREYPRGLCLGFVVLFAGLLVIDTFLHNRVIHLLDGLKQVLPQI